jgi:drug/metabolite transporter (DMT)-like permease
VHVPDPAKRRQAIFIVLACTLLVALAQYLIKLGANHLSHAGLVATAIGIFTIPTLFAGYCLYGVFTVLFVYALRHGELSILYPLIALSYVWVTITGVVAFHEVMNPLRVTGLVVIVAGVAVLGWGGGGGK